MGTAARTPAQCYHRQSSGQCMRQVRDAGEGFAVLQWDVAAGAPAQRVHAEIHLIIRQLEVLEYRAPGTCAALQLGRETAVPLLGAEVLALDLKALREVRQWGLLAKEITCSPVISACGQTCGLFGQVRQQGLQPNVIRGSSPI